METQEELAARLADMAGSDAARALQATLRENRIRAAAWHEWMRVVWEARTQILRARKAKARAA
jgi:hypothetical protein